jgi:DNA polymerase-3 subunit delta'
MVPSTEIIGHESQLQALRKDLETDNVAHAYLFAGKRHLGKFTAAKWFAETLLLSDVSETEREKRRHEIDRLLYRDLLVIDQLWIEESCEDFDVIARYSNVPQQHRQKAKAKTDSISIEDIRALQGQLHEVGGGRFRCCLIRSVERMQEEAVNALLKILEEPPPGVVFLLTTEHQSRLLPTLVSRTRVLRFSPLSRKELVPLVRDANAEDASFLLRLSQGAPGVILRLRGDPDLLRAERQRYTNALSFWHARTLGERLRQLEPLNERGEDAEQFLLHLALALREERTPDSVRRTAALLQLTRDLRTNASKPLLAQRFALAVG